MSDHKHYTPILKWKSAEAQALAKLSEKEKDLISPLIQLVMPSPKIPKKGDRIKTAQEQFEETIKDFEENLLDIPKEIDESWGKRPIFLDLSLLYTAPLKIKTFENILSVGEQMKLNLVPVINLSSEEEIKKTTVNAVKKNKHGLCLRLVGSDFADIEKLSSSLQDLLQKYDLLPRDIDLLVDLKEYEDGKYIKCSDMSQQIPDLSAWRGFIIASGAFPEDLSKCTVGDKNPIPRRDWDGWMKQVTSSTIKRKPSFADYTIQHPVYKEMARFFSPSASIRYTLYDKWIVMRGQRGKHVQYLANANILSGLPEFFGENFSYGDAYIKEKGKDLKSNKPGNATTWLVAGINHHIACVASQLASLRD
jgi:hypothetical protein